ncbi:MAG TPA: hypothetical protein VMH48_06120 [Methylomirabilota bacterium]|nr:hypothetical protein [Methylomirabilota bacterium]
MRNLNLLGLLLTIVFLAPGKARAQARAENPPAGAPDISPGVPEPQRAAPAPHRFWDKENAWLFEGVAAMRTMDYFSTLNMRRRGRQEILLTNDAVDNHAAFSMIEAAATGASMSASFLFHHYGHHKLEHWTSFVHIGVAATGSVRNYCLKTAHNKPVP